ncbi:Tn3 family transposase [Streptosporangium canum]|uniref:Tn3 family transposase n=1 Tax=Streptosporangium canum TaxID=324952 RepID=UPI0033AF9F49
MSWLRTNKVLLPGVTTLTRLIARVRDEATERLHETLYGILSPRQQAILTRLLEVPEGPALTDLQLPEHPETLLAEHALVLHLALRDVAARLGTDGVDVIVDEEGRLHVARLKAMPEPPSLVDLRKRVVGMLPRVDLSELLLEVMGRVPGFAAAFTSVAGGVSKLSDFHVSVAACLTASALNIGYAPVVKAGTAALERARLSHVAQNYLSAETFSLANAPLIEEQAKIGFARKLGGGLVAAIDGMRFVVPVGSRTPTTGRWRASPAGRSTWPRSNGTGETSCGWCRCPVRGLWP